MTETALAADRHGTTDGRTPLVFLHGLSYDRRQWAPTLDALARIDPGRPALTLDLPGHGQSPGRDSYRSDQVIALVHRAIEDAGLSAPIVVGHSLGAVLATGYAATYPVRGVVNVDQPLLVAPFAGLLHQLEPVLRSPDYQQIWDRFVAGMHVELLPPAAQHLVRTATTPRQDLLLGYWDELLTTPTADLTERFRHELETIRGSGIPYHYVCGAEPDPQYRRWLEAALPDVTITVLPDSGHFPHLADPAGLAELLTELPAT